jgi:CRP-like cAMP-binding protein
MTSNKQAGCLQTSGEKSFMARGLILGRASISARLAAFLIVAAPRLPPKDGGLDFPFSQGDIASYLGTTPETICRAMRQLREMNIIAMPIRGCLAVRSFDALKAIADGID